MASPATQTLLRAIYRVLPGKRPSRERRLSNAWLRRNVGDIEGRVLSIGSQHDADREGGRYRDYFGRAKSYATSEVTAETGADLVLDVRRMPEVADESYDCIFCSGVLEHVDDYPAALSEMTRVLRRGGILLLGVPFRQAIHNAPLDFWRFTEGAIRFLLKDRYEILMLDPIETSVPNFPASYWVKARRR
jgi:SAM-dependent methyltransferase